MNNRDRQIIEKIIAEIAVADSFTHNLDLAGFTADERTCRAVCMTLINIGELVKSLTDELRSANPQIPWRSIAGLENLNT